MKPDPVAMVHIKELSVSAVIGTRPQERIRPQELLMGIEFSYDAALAAETDAIGHAVDYAAIHARIVEKVADREFFLLERLAAVILEVIMEDQKIIFAAVTLEKFGVLPGAKSVTVRMSAGDKMGKGPVSGAPLRCY